MGIFYTHFIPIFWLVFCSFYDISVLTPLSFLFVIRTKSRALRQYEAKKSTNQQIPYAAAATVFQYFQL